MTDERKLIAKALREYAKATRKTFRGDKTEWARAYRRAMSEVDAAAVLIEGGEFDAIKEIGQ